MSTNDLSVAILREIRDEIRSTNSRIDALGAHLGARIDGTNARLDTLGAGVNARIDLTNERLEVVEHTLKDIAGQQLMLTRYVKNSNDRRDRDIDELDQRVTRIETRLDKP
jgi:hypothetical protein